MYFDFVCCVFRFQQGLELGKECMFIQGKGFLEFFIYRFGRVYVILYFFKEWVYKRNEVMDIFIKGFFY